MGAGRELSALRSDGTTFAAEISLGALDVEEGRFVSAAVRDTTERRRAEARFRGLLEAAPDAMVGVDSEGRIVMVNGQAERLFAYSREELLGKPVEILVPEAVRHAHPEYRTRYFARPTTRPMGVGLELAGRRSDGTEFPAEISVPQTPSSGAGRADCVPTCWSPTWSCPGCPAGSWPTAWPRCCLSSPSCSCPGTHMT